MGISITTPSKMSLILAVTITPLFFQGSASAKPTEANPNGPSAPRSPVRATGSSSAYVNWYPSSISLPQGMSYPCALTPLPTSLPGIPAGDRNYINHVYTMLLKCVQAKTIMLSKLRPGEARSAYSRYYADTRAALETIRKEPTPAGLESFRNQVMNAIVLQVTFFSKATAAAENGTDGNTIMQIPEGRQASNLLMSAWGEMQGRYPQWSEETKDSMYHHLCALDLF